MGENLYAIPTTAAEVQDIQQRALNLATPDNTDILCQGLDAMITATETLEKQLYIDLGCRDYRGFLRKIAEIDQFNGLLGEGPVFQYYAKNYVFPVGVKQEEAVKDLEYLINYGILSDKDIMNEILEASDENIKDTMLSIIRERFRDLPVIETNGKSRRVRVRYTGAGGKAVGLARLNFIREKDGNVSVSYGEDTFLSKPLLQKIQMAANMIIKHSSKPNIEVAFPTVEAFKEDVNKIIHKYHPNISLNLLKVLGKEADISRSYAGLKGYLGEIRAFLVFGQLTNSKNVDVLRITGAIKGYVANSTHKKELPIDLIVKMGLSLQGFQVKNYKLQEGWATFENGMSIANFIDGRLVLTGTMKEILVALFGSYQYNQPFEDQELINKIQADDNQMTVDSYRDVIYNEFTNIMTGTSIKKLFDSRIGNILRVGTEFNADEIFGKRDMYYNTMFLIADDYVPSSIILRSIREQINAPKNDLWRSEYEVGPVAPSPKLEDAYTQEKGKGHLASSLYSVLYDGKKPRIDYSISLNVKELVKKAVSNLTN